MTICRIRFEEWFLNKYTGSRFTESEIMALAENAHEVWVAAWNEATENAAKIVEKYEKEAADEHMQ